MAELRWWRQETALGEMTVVVSDHGIRAISLPGGAEPEELLGDAVHERDDEIARRLDEWFDGTRHDVGVPVDLDGIGGFRREVLDTLVREVGWGETVTYGELAGMAGRPRAARAVGRAMATNPVPFVVPCHRVVASGGGIGGYGGVWSTGRAVELKRRLLAREGVKVKG